jgi:hypothetical protein
LLFDSYFDSCRYRKRSKAKQKPRSTTALVSAHLHLQTIHYPLHKEWPRRAHGGTQGGPTDLLAKRPAAYIVIWLRRGQSGFPDGVKGWGVRSLFFVLLDFALFSIMTLRVVNLF